MFKGKRIAKLERELFEIKAKSDGTTLSLIKLQTHIESDIRNRFDKELAQYRAAVQGTITDRIKFDVLEEWLNDVFKLNGLKFTDSDFIKRDERAMLESEIREKIAREIEEFKIAQNLSTNNYIEAFPILQETLAKLVRKK